jgi:hypothetical protein
MLNNERSVTSSRVFEWLMGADLPAKDVDLDDILVE